MYPIGLIPDGSFDKQLKSFYVSSCRISHQNSPANVSENHESGHREVGCSRFNGVLYHEVKCVFVQTMNGQFISSIGPGTGLSLSRECLSHDTTYFSNVLTNIRKYVVTWLEHFRESDRRYPNHS